MPSSEIKIEQVIALILDQSSEDLRKQITSVEANENLLFLFWAAEQIERKIARCTEKQRKHFKNQMKLLNSAKHDIIVSKLSESLKNYCPDFLIGTLEYTIRKREAQIDRFEEYTLLFEKFKSWERLGFKDERQRKLWERSLNGLNEVYGWMNERAETFFITILPIINVETYQRFQSSGKKLIKLLRKGRTDNHVFQILAALSHSNPILYQRVTEYCSEKDTTIPDKELLASSLTILRNTTDDSKVKEYCNLLLKSFTFKVKIQ